MQTFLQNADVTLTVALQDENGNPYEATALEYRVLDENDVEIVARAPLSSFTSGDVEAEIAIPAISNQLAAGKKSGARKVELFLTLASGVVTLSTYYALNVVGGTLVVPTNSFMTYTMANLLATEIPNIPGWDAASESQRIAALKEARDRIGKYRYRFYRDVDNWQEYIEPYFAVGDINLLSTAQYNNLPDFFTSALHKAQLVEADSILGGNKTDDIRDDGLMSMTIGESSQMYRPGKSARTVLCKRAMVYLSKYIDNVIRLTRT